MQKLITNPAAFLPSELEAVIWHYDVSRLSPDFERLKTKLPERDIARAQRFVNPDDANLHLAGRIMLRAALGHWLSCPGEAVEIETSIRGKPVCVASTGLSFNIAHSGTRVALALLNSRGENDAVGIDVERKRDLANYDVIAQRSFAPAAFQEIRGLSGKAKHDRFYYHWTRYEAGLKALGFGLAADAAEMQQLEALHYQPVEIHPDYAACLATVAKPARITMHNLNEAAMGGAA